MINVKENFKVIFHAAGGVTLQTDKYVHHFKGWVKDNPYYTATYTVSKRIAKLLRGGTSNHWEDNEPDKRIHNIGTSIWRDDHYNQDKVVEIVSEQNFNRRLTIIRRMSLYIEAEVFKTLWKMIDRQL